MTDAPLSVMDVQILSHRWTVGGLPLGPKTVIPVRAILGQDKQITYERRDGKPIGDLAGRFADQLSHCPAELQRLADVRQQSGKAATTSRMVRKGVATSEPGDGTLPIEKTSSSVFTVDREQITDRINRLRNRASQTQLEPVPSGVSALEPTPAATTTPLPATPTPLPMPESPPAPSTGRHAHLKPEQRDAVAAMAALREKQWKAMRTPLPTDSTDGLDFTPLSTPVSVPETQVEKRSSSVFRYDRDVVTDRLKRVKALAGKNEDKPADPPLATPAEPPPPT